VGEPACAGRQCADAAACPLFLQVALGGSLAPAGRRGSGERRHPVAMAGLAFMLAAVVALGVVAVVVVEDEAGPVALADKGGAAVHSLHFINSLHPEEAARAVEKDGIGDKNNPAALAASASSIVGTTRDEQLASARLAAQNRLARAQVPKRVQAENREELKLKQELDASVQAKEKNALAMSPNSMKSILAEAAEANKAKNLKVKVTNVNANSDDTSEEAALRKQLDDDARVRQANMLKKSDPALDQVRGRHESMTVAASHLARKVGKQLSESALEAELRNQLNSKVKNEESSMFKTAVNRWLGKNHAASHTAGARGRSIHRLHKKAAKASSAKNSLVMAEKLMKRELGMAQHPAQDTTLNHSPLAKASSAKGKQRGLAQLENAMLKSTLNKARQDGPKLRQKHEMMHKLRTAAKAKKLKDAVPKPSYQTAMHKFAARLMHKEDSARHRYLRHPDQAGVVDKKALEEAIKKKVASKLSRGSKKLQAERAQLMQQFNNGNSLFAKAERKELKQLQGQTKPHELAAPDVKDAWHL